MRRRDHGPGILRARTAEPAGWLRHQPGKYRASPGDVCGRRSVAVAPARARVPRLAADLDPGRDARVRLRVLVVGVRAHCRPAGRAQGDPPRPAPRRALLPSALAVLSLLLGLAPMGLV